MHLGEEGQTPDVDVIIYDIGNVVVVFDDKKGLKALQRLGMGGGDIQIDELFGGPRWNRFCRGKLPEAEFRQDMRDLFEIVSASDDQIDEAIGDVFTLIDSTIAIIAATRAKYPQLRHVALSNVEPPRDRVLEKMGVWSRFDATVKSCEVGMAKPDHAIFRLALERANCARFRALFVDDVPKNVLAAAELGIAGHLYQNEAGLRAFLALHNIHI